MRLPRECHDQSQDSNWRHCVTGKTENCNAILVDLSKGASNLLNYPQAAGNTPPVGRQISVLIRFFISNGNNGPGSVDRFYIVGFSLGAQTAGYAGSYLKVDYNLILGCITGKFFFGFLRCFLLLSVILYLTLNLSRSFLCMFIFRLLQNHQCEKVSSDFNQCMFTSLKITQEFPRSEPKPQLIGQQCIVYITSLEIAYLI